jgi:Tfp pilus assembly protein PilF
MGLMLSLLALICSVALAQDTLDLQLSKAIELSNTGRYLQARAVLEQVRVQAAERDPVGSRMAVVLNNLGAVALRLNEVHDAEQCYRRSAEIWEAHGDVTSRLAPITNLAAVYIARRQFTAADKLLGRQMELVLNCVN